jgi:hypothetical protein
MPRAAAVPGGRAEAAWPSWGVSPTSCRRSPRPSSQAGWRPLSRSIPGVGRSGWRWSRLPRPTFDPDSAFALAVPVLPFGNLALGAALLYAGVAAALLGLSWQEPKTGLLCVAGPILAPFAALGLLPLVALPIRSALRRAGQAAAAVLTAGLVAGIRHVSMPFDGAAAPHGLGLAGSESVTDTASALWHALMSRPALVTETIVLAAAAALLPYVRARGLWWIAGFGAALLPALLLPVPEVAAIPLVVSVWATCAAVAFR